MFVTLVLYSFGDNLWKISDFGISTEGTSKRARTTKLARGTPCYRPPELVRDVARFTNKVDMWSLGCVLYELASWKKAFRDDFDVVAFAQNADRQLEISWPDDSAFLGCQYVLDVVYELLNRIPEKRPDAPCAQRMLTSFCHVLGNKNCHVVYNSILSMSYDIWKHLVEKVSYQSGFDISLRKVVGSWTRARHCSQLVEGINANAQWKERFPFAEFNTKI